MTAPLRIPQGDLAREYGGIHEEIDAAVKRVLSRGEFILGPETEAFEREYASWLGVKHAVSCASGTEAITLALLALGVGPGDEVVLPVNTCMPTASGIALTGARPVGADVDAKSLMLDARSARAALGTRTRAVVAVHLYGAPADMDELSSLGLPIIEDCAQAHGASFKGRKAGTIGKLSCFSFYPSKNLGAYGDAGLVATNEDELAARLKMCRNYGYSRRDCSEMRGLNSRMDEIQAAILRTKLPHLDGWNLLREKKATFLRGLLAEILGVEFPQLVPGGRSVHHLFPILTGRRDELSAHLGARGIMTRVHYPIPLHLQPVHSYWGQGPGTFPVAESAAARLLSLPLFPQITDAELSEVAAAVREFFRA